MNNFLEKLNQVVQYDDTSCDGVIIINKNGIVEYSIWCGRMTNSILPGWTKAVVGKPLLSFYEELTEENSTIFRTLRTGKATVDPPQSLTWKHYRITFSGETYPIVENNIVQAAANVIKLISLQDLKTGEYLKEQLYCLDDIVTQSPQMERIKAMILEVGKSDSPGMIYGETGTGKELVAESLHSEGKRRAGKFISQNCAAIPANLLESIFFGTEKGGFTGAETREGLFDMADGGTLFLDEINSMDMAMQAKLLKVIEEQKSRRIGGDKDYHFDVRLVCATNEPVERLLAEKRIREDLFYRIGVVYIEIPPLRQRPEDIPLLTDHFIHEYNGKMDRQIQSLSPLAEQVFRSWSWPGNVRELRNTIESAFNLERGEKISLDSVKGLLRKAQEQSGTSRTADRPQAAMQGAQLSPALPFKSGEILNLDQLLEDYERQIILSVMREETRLIDVAARLSMSPQKLNYRIKKLKIKEQLEKNFLIH